MYHVFAGQVDLLVLHVGEMNACEEDLPVGAIHERESWHDLSFAVGVWQRQVVKQLTSDLE